MLSIEEMRRALEVRLGRSPSVRQVIGREHYYLQDPLVSHVQRGDHKFRFDYRNGLLVDLEQEAIYFSLMHCPAVTKHFKGNFDFNRFLAILEHTRFWRDRHVLGWSSVADQKDVWIIEEDHSIFKEALLRCDAEWGLPKDLFFGLDRRRHTNPSGKRGNYFSTLIGYIDRINSADELLNEVMPLLGWCLPSEQHPGRVASLAASLRGAGIAERCEFSSITGAPSDFYQAECSGRIEGAHIKPHAQGGGAGCDNGLWLCNSHHRMSEGRISGTRKVTRWKGRVESGRGDGIAPVIPPTPPDMRV